MNRHLKQAARARRRDCGVRDLSLRRGRRGRRPEGVRHLHEVHTAATTVSPAPASWQHCRVGDADMAPRYHSPAAAVADAGRAEPEGEGWLFRRSREVSGSLDDRRQ